MANSVFGYILPQAGDPKEDTTRRFAYASWFALNIPEEEFEGVDRIIFHYIKEMTRISTLLKYEHFSNLMSRTLLPYLLKNKLKIDETREYSFDNPADIDTIVNTTKGIVLQHYAELVDTKAYIVEDFPMEAKLFFEDQKKAKLIGVLQSGFHLMTNLKDGRTGVDDAMLTVSERIAEIEELYSDEKLEDLVSETRADDVLFEFVSDYGIVELDTDTKGMFKGQLVGVDGPPGGGKTRFGVGVCTYRALVNHKKNVIYYALEQAESEIKAMLITIHVYNMFGEIISDDIILKGMLKDDRLKRMVETAKRDLFDSGLYGKLVVISGDLYVNNMYDRFKMHDRVKGPFDIVVVDYMFVIQHKPQQYQKAMDFVEIIKRSYRLFKKYCLREGKAGFAINQLNEAGINASNKDLEITTNMSAGGIEVYRNTDYHIVITYTKEMEAQNRRRISVPKKRSTVGAGRFMVATSLGMCGFSSIGGTL